LAPQQRYALDQVRAGIARRIAATQPAEARRLVASIDESERPSAERALCVALASTDLAAARGLAAGFDDPWLEALLPGMAARALASSRPDEARSLLRESVERLAKVDDVEGRESPALALARLMPLALRVDPDRAVDDFWLALSLRPPLSSQPEPMPVSPQVRQHYVGLAELAVLVARHDRATAEAVFAPVAARLVRMDDDDWGLGGEGPTLFQLSGAFDARIARSLLEALPEDPAPPSSQPNGHSRFRHQSKAQARIALARALALPPNLRLSRSPAGD
jgi:hypothetical protein